MEDENKKKEQDELWNKLNDKQKEKYKEMYKESVTLSRLCTNFYTKQQYLYGYHLLEEIFGQHNLEKEN